MESGCMEEDMCRSGRGVGEGNGPPQRAAEEAAGARVRSAWEGGRRGRSLVEVADDWRRRRAAAALSERRGQRRRQRRGRGRSGGHGLLVVQHAWST